MGTKRRKGKATKRRTRTARVRRNPAGQVIGTTVAGIEFKYRHKADGKLYKHRAGRGVVIRACPDGSLRLSRADGKSLWGHY